jgi:indolepyruvate ferredoxin oxidoreductase, beta subunit
MKTFNIHLAGVGGQGIGLLSEMILRAADYAGHPVKAVDTHGLAQRGGIVVSQIRMGAGVFAPLIREHQADLVVALERHEALRALIQFAKPNGVLIYYDTVWQPLDVRLGTQTEVSAADIEIQCRQSGVRPIAIRVTDLADVRTQNVVLLAHIDRHGLLPGLETRHYLQAMADLLTGRKLDMNTALFKQQRSMSA